MSDTCVSENLVREKQDQQGSEVQVQNKKEICTKSSWPLSDFWNQVHGYSKVLARKPEEKVQMAIKSSN